MAVDKSGNLSVAYYKFGGGPIGFEIRDYAAKTYKPLRTISNNISYPNALAFDVSGNLFVSNVGSNSVLAYAPGRLAFFRNFPANGPSALAVAPTTFPSP